MRLEATLSDPRAEQLQQLADELRLTKSQVIEEALALFQKAVLEVRRGRRVAIIEAASQQAVCEVATPALTQLEWTAHRTKLTLSEKASGRLLAAEKEAAAPTEALKKAFSRKRRGQ